MNIAKLVSFSVGPAVSAIISLATLPIMSWYFPVEDIGRYTILITSIAFLVTLCSLGLHQAYVREYHEVENPAGLLKLVTVISFAFFITLFSVVVLTGLPVSSILFGVGSPLLDGLFYLAVLSSLVIHFLSHSLRMEERGWAYSAAQLTPKVIFLVLMSVTIWLQTGSNFFALQMIFVFSVTASCVAFVLVSFRTIKSAVKSSLEINRAIPLLRFSGPLMIGGLVYWGLSASDRFFLRILADLVEVGVYGIAITIAGAISILSTIFSNMWHPVVYKWAKNGLNMSSLRAVVENMFLGVATVWSLAGVFSWVPSLFLPDEYLAVQYIVTGCIGAALFQMLSEATVVGIGLSRKTGYGLIPSTLAVVINVLLNVFLVKSFGASGAAVSAVIAFFVFFVVRTELSAYLGYSVPRKAIYVLLVGYVSLTCWVALARDNSNLVKAIWILLLVVTYIGYHQRVLWNIKAINGKYRRRNVDC